MNLGHVFLAKKEEKKALSYYLRSIEIYSNKDLFWKEMEEDFQYLTQYGINQDYYQSVLQKIRESTESSDSK